MIALPKRWIKVTNPETSSHAALANVLPIRQYERWRATRLWVKKGRKRVMLEPLALVLLASSVADNGVSPGLVLRGERGDAGRSIVQALHVAASVIGPYQHGLDIEHDIRIGRRQREEDAG